MLVILVASLWGILLINIFPRVPVISDFADYDSIARSIVAFGVYPTISPERLIYPPLYPLFLAVGYAAGLSWPEIYLVQFIVLGLIAWLTSRLVGDLSKNYKWISGVAFSVVMLWPYFLLYAQVISNEVLFSLFLLAAVALTIEAFDRPADSRRMMFLGGTYAVAVLIRPVALLLLPWTLGWIFITSGSYSWTSIRTFIGRWFLAIFTFVIVLAPWLIFSRVQFGYWFPVASNLGAVFSKANETMSYLGDSASSETLARAKIKNFFWFWSPGAGGYHAAQLINHYPLARWGIVFYQFFYYLILALAALGAWKFRHWPIAVIPITVFYFWSLHTVLFPFPRYTLPIIPLVIILACVGFINILNFFHRDR